MKRRINPMSTFIGYVILTVCVATVVTIAMFVYSAIDGATDGNKTVISVVMLAVILVLSIICTLIDYLRRKLTADKTVSEILDATDRIASGDFSVRLKPTHSVNRYDEYDYIIENLNKMAEELSHTEMLHSDFVSNVSHEIKTPLAVIQNYAASLQNKNLDEATRVKYAKTLSDATKKLTALITDILKLNKLENQEITETAAVDLTETLGEAVLAFEELMDDKNIELECDFDEDVKIFSAPSYLEIVWNNLLSNAIKFTEPGGKIVVSLKAADGNATVKMSDTGCGISPETGKHIFEKFYQGDTSHASDGNGLGLALVKKVIDKIGGKITVESEIGKGTTFTVTLKTDDRA